jgi:predicted Zn-dependent peptidase
MSFTFKDQPRHTLPTTISIPEIALHRLQGGDSIYVLSTESTQLIQLEIRFKAGSWHQKLQYQALLTGKMLSEGTKSHTSQTIAETLDFYGGYYAISVDKDFSSAQFVFPQIHLSKILPIIAEILFESTFPENELKMFKDNLSHQIRLDNQQGDVIANKKLFSTIFGSNHPYGRSGTPEDVACISRADLIEFYHTHYLTKNATIFIVGDIQDEALNLIRQYLSPSRNIEVAPRKDFIIAPSREQKKIIHRDQSTQTSIRIGKVLFPKNHPDFIDLHIATTVLGGYFGSRLMSNLREDKGYTYGIGSYLISYLNSGFFGISTEVNLEHTEEAIAEIYKEIDLLQSHPIADEELHRVKNYLTGTYLKNFDGSFNIMNQYVSLVSQNLTQEFTKNYLESIFKITPTRIQELFNQYLDITTFSEIIVSKSVKYN